MEGLTLQECFNASMPKKEGNYQRNNSVWNRIQATLAFLDSISDDAGITNVQFTADPSGAHELNIRVEMVDMSLDLRNSKECVAGLLSADAMAFEQNKNEKLLVTFRFNDLWTET